MPLPLYMQQYARDQLSALRIVTEKLDVLFVNSFLKRTSLCSTGLTPQVMRDEHFEHALHWGLKLMQAEKIAGPGLHVVGEDTPPRPGEPGFTSYYLMREVGEAGTITMLPQPLMVLQEAIRKGMFDKNEMVTWMLEIPDGADVQAFAADARYWLALFQLNQMMPDECQIVTKQFESGREICFVADENGKRLPPEKAR